MILASMLFLADIILHTYCSSRGHTDVRAHYLSSTTRSANIYMHSQTIRL